MSMEVELKGGLLLVPAAVALRLCEKDFLSRMREQDAREVTLATGLTPLQAVRRSVRASDEALVALVLDRPVALFGVASASSLSRVGHPWLLVTDDVERYPLMTLKTSAAAIASMFTEYDLLTNMIWAGNEPALRFVRWLGATVGAPFEWGTSRAKFRQFAFTKTRFATVWPTLLEDDDV